MNFSSRIFLWFFTIFFFITACSENEKTVKIDDSFASYVSNNSSTIFFGKIVFKDFIENLEFRDLPKLNILLSKEVSTLSKGLDLKDPIYFTVDNLLQSDGTPSNIFLFIKVKNQDSLADKFSSLGYLIERNENELDILGENLSGKITPKLAIIHLSKKASKKTISIVRVGHTHF